MASGASDKSFKIGVELDARTQSGAQQAISDVERAKQATLEANEQLATSAETTAAAASEASAAQARAAQIAEQYGVSVEVAARAIQAMESANQRVVVGSNELGAAILAAKAAYPSRRGRCRT
jgi:hypothetical protein